MKFGIQPTEGGTLTEEALAEVIHAEEMGFDSVWLSEHHGVQDHYWPSPLLMLSALAARTERIFLGTNVIILPFYHPRRVVEEAAMLQALSRGRFILGVGMGYREEEYAAYGVSLTERGRRYEEALVAIRHLMRQDGAAFHGRFFHLAPLAVEPWVPFPVWAGGWGRENLRRAAVYADAWIPGPVADLRQLMACRAQYEEFVRRAGGDPGARPRVLTRELIVAPTRSKALAAAERYLLPIYRDEYGGGWRHRLVHPDQAHDMEALGTERFIVGSPEDVIAGVKFFAERLGCDHLIFRLYGPHTPHAFIMEEITLLGTEVLPAFKTS
ncbi:MAG: LLM class flavin-dependent oxidoreductase [Armatimonadota bacterium]|nr:LLM class flavin-dependent oxidoreductase [Armatimonadota bacterium]MDR7401921.1 LLM class flavin-dependent oxidoreductase [Armatimonadota bacterium]MDR7405032.1 LLM class flavin-dependent oxidoreductase [Armatimonadota bacterium]MDR7471528.1 LLM class flavin-dependent oxidoreductase [Armatimonadota bacterium]MDR7507804.1 LLM class flavin-dependent oxidoreductase [Armatimonadota bacterium]